MTKLKVFKTHPDAPLPVFSTKQAACFDIAACFAGKASYSGFNKTNAPFERNFQMYTGVVVMPGDRVMCPTGLIFDIPEGHSVRIHPRSGLSYKNGIVLANQEAVIDSDYFHETFILLTNITDAKFTINNGDRIAQGELIKNEIYTVEETKDQPKQKTDRNGGIGSTGVKKRAKAAKEKV